MNPAREVPGGLRKAQVRSTEAAGPSPKGTDGRRLARPDGKVLDYIVGL